MGSSFLGVPYKREGHDISSLSACVPPGEISRSSCACANSPTMGSYIQGHIAMTYCSVLTLHVLGDDFSRLQKTSVIAGEPYITLLQKL